MAYKNEHDISSPFYSQVCGTLTDKYNVHVELIYGSVGYCMPHLNCGTKGPNSSDVYSLKSKTDLPIAVPNKTQNVNLKTVTREKYSFFLPRDLELYQ